MRKGQIETAILLYGVAIFLIMLGLATIVFLQRNNVHWDTAMRVFIFGTLGTMLTVSVLLVYTGCKRAS